MREFFVIETLLAATFFTASTIIFGITQPWKKLTGRILFSCLTNMTVVLLLVCSSFIFRAWTTEDKLWARFLIFTLTFINGLTILVSIVAAQLSGSNFFRGKEVNRERSDLA